MKMSIKTMQNFTLIFKLLRKVQKIHKQKSYRQKRVQNWGFSSSILLIAKVFGKYLFLGALFSIISTDLKSAWNSAFFEYSYPKKESKKFWGHCVHIWVLLGTSIMQIRKKWLSQLKNFLTNIFKNIIWHLFAGESHQVVKITVTYYTVSLDSSWRNLLITAVNKLTI